MHMGRRPIGRKYAKHISIQVNDEHNEDLKYLASKLNKVCPLPNGKRWTIRDIILTLLYTQHNNSPDWFTKNHFEQIDNETLVQIRQKIRSGDSPLDHPVVMKTEARFTPTREVQIKKPKSSKSKLQIKINSDYQSYINNIHSIQTEGEN